MGMEPEEPSASSSENNSGISGGYLERELSELGLRSLFCASPIPLTAEDLKLVGYGEEIIEEPSSIEKHVDEPSTSEVFEDNRKSENISPQASTSDSEDYSSSKPPNFQWRGFLKKLKKVPAKGLHSFHPSIPSLPSVRKFSRKKSRNFEKSMPSLPDELDGEFYCFQSSWNNFSLPELQSATNNFSPENLIGEGGYSQVYRGHLQDGKLVAIKRLIRGTPEEMTSDFLSELGILVHVDHPNIANVIGYGVEGGMHLVLPLSPHGSLASLLRGEKQILNWGIRQNVAAGTAIGLSYLHEGCQRRIVHRDIKAANILLTEDFEPQISDFGLAKWLPDQWTHLTVSQYEGTFGYLPPEFFLHGLVDEKTDVYAFGVLLLELITGRPALDESKKSLVLWAKPLITARNMGELVDPSLGSAYDSEELHRMVIIASLCIQQNSADRPKMSQVLQMLKGDEGILQGKKKFKKIPAFKISYSVKLLDEEDYNPNNFLNDLNQQNEIAQES